MVKRLEQTRIMHRAVEHNGVLYLGGIVADDTSASMREQTRQACEKIATLLERLGSHKTKVLMAQIFITDMSLKEEMNASWLEWLDGEDLPSRATIGVADLGGDTLIEIVVTAAA
jgi:enamine deaminase RidA (YjgF/YER057c/UK114 family)